MTRILFYALALSLLANVFLALGWQTARVAIKTQESRAAIAEVARARELAAEKDRASSELAAVRSRIPKAGRKVSDAASSAPSECSVSPVVGNSLRESVRAGNAARRNAGSVP